jgi:hypothetical protein
MKYLKWMIRFILLILFIWVPIIITMIEWPLELEDPLYQEMWSDWYEKMRWPK